MSKNLDKFYILVAIFVATYIFSPILSGGRDIALLGYPIMPGSLLTIVNVAILGVIQQNYGKDIASKIVVGGIIARVVIWSFTLLTLLLPTASAIPGYDRVVFSGFRILLAGILARYVGIILIDIPMFQKVKERYNSFSACLVISLITDTIIGRSIFIVAAKYGTDTNLVDRFIAQGTVSVVFILILAPVVAVLNRLLFPKPVGS